MLDCEPVVPGVPPGSAVECVYIIFVFILTADFSKTAFSTLTYTLKAAVLGIICLLYMPSGGRSV